MKISTALLIILMRLHTSATASALAPIVSYDELLQAIRQTQAESQARIEAVVEQEKMREAWEIVKLIDENFRRSLVLENGGSERNVGIYFSNRGTNLR